MRKMISGLGFLFLLSPGFAWAQSSSSVSAPESGQDVDFAAMAAQAAAAKVAREQAEQALRERMDVATAALLEKAAADFLAIEPLMRDDPAPETRPVIEAYVAHYGDAKVQVDDVSEPLSVPEVVRARDWLARGAMDTTGDSSAASSAVEESKTAATQAAEEAKAKAKAKAKANAEKAKAKAKSKAKNAAKDLFE